MAKVRISHRLSRSDVSIDHDSGIDFQELVRANLERPVGQARQLVAKAVAITANKLKMWATVHLQQATKLGRSTAVFEKIINNPLGTATQIAHGMMGIKTQEPMSREQKKLDDLIDEISL